MHPRQVTFISKIKLFSLKPPSFKLNVNLDAHFFYIYLYSCLIQPLHFTQLPKSFNGCLKDLTINGEEQDIHSNGRPVHVTRDCHEQIDEGFYMVPPDSI